MSNIFFTADTHLDHERMIVLSKRPFQSRDEMNSTIIDNWNRVVHPQDTVYHLGDFAFATNERVTQLLRMLNGHKHLIQGNHDDEHVGKARGWASTRFYYRVRKALPTSIILFHYPIEIWDRRHYGSVHLFGHLHGRPLERSSELRHDVGVDANNFTPVSIDVIKTMMEQRVGAQMKEDWSDVFRGSRAFDESIPHFYRRDKVVYDAHDAPRDVQ